MENGIFKAAAVIIWLSLFQIIGVVIKLMITATIETWRFARFVWADLIRPASVDYRAENNRRADQRERRQEIKFRKWLEDQE